MRHLEFSEDIQLRRIIQENGKLIVRVKNRCDQELLEEWVQVVNELDQKRLLKENDVDLRLEIAKKKVLSEMVTTH